MLGLYAVDLPAKRTESSTAAYDVDAAFVPSNATHIRRDARVAGGRERARVRG